MKDEILLMEAEEANTHGRKWKHEKKKGRPEMKAELRHDRLDSSR